MSTEGVTGFFTGVSKSALADIELDVPSLSCRDDSLFIFTCEYGQPNALKNNIKAMITFLLKIYYIYVNCLLLTQILFCKNILVCDIAMIFNFVKFFSHW